jgi:hypothetical protein
VPELNDTADITERISQARKLFGSMNKQLLGNKKYTDRYPSQALSSDCCEYSTLGSESWALKDRQVQTGSFPPWMSPQDVRADDVGCSRETDHE